MKKLIIAAVALALVALPAVGFAITQNSEPAQEFEQYLEIAAKDMGLDLAQAKGILEQARELRLRMMGQRKGFTYEEMQEKMEERRNQGGNSLGRRGMRGGKGICFPEKGD